MKILIVGKPNTGKSALIHRLLFDQFKHAPIPPTIGIDYHSWTCPITQTRVQLCDTSGHVVFRPIMTSYLQHAHVALVVFNPQDLDPPDDWIREVILRPHCQLILVAHHHGPDASAPLPAWSKRYTTLACNASTGHGVRHTFQEVVRLHAASLPSPPTEPTQSPTAPNTWWRCCWC